MILTVDAIILIDDKLVVVQRNTEPFKDKLALPGGKVKEKELLREAVVREVREETGLDVKPFAMLGVYDNITRDPRGRYISMVYLCGLEKPFKEFKFDKKEIKDVQLIDLKDVLEDKILLAFDHNQMVKNYRALLGLGKKNEK